MKNNIENTPDYIFDWLGEFSFEELAPAKQKEVLKHFSAEEYNDLHGGYMAVKQAGYRPGKAGRNRKEELLTRFDEAYGKQKPVLRLFTLRVSLWKAASVFLVVAGGLLFLKVNGGQPPASGALSSKTDTVYLTREIRQKPVEILDTVYIYQEPNTRTVKTKSKSSVETPSGSGEYSHGQSDIHVLSVDEINGISNQVKGSSIKDDTLVKKFSFVGLL